MRNVVVLGSTGSVGKSALEVIEAFPDSFRVTGLSAHSSVDDLIRQALKFRPRIVTVSDPASLDALRTGLADEDVAVLPFADAVAEMTASPETDIVLDAIVGAAGLAPALAALRAGKTLAIANKEPLVAAGPLMMATARECGGRIVPVDSEHSAIFQVLRAGRPDEVRQILLTGSGGPFRTRPLGTFAGITREEALNHPTWSMGRKISIDSATMMNKALEIVEAVFLFDLPPEKVRVLIHPQSVVHSMVEFRDGSVVAQAGTPDMKLPVLYALAHPDRPEYEAVQFRLDEFRTLTFDDPDPERYPALELGYRAVRAGGTAGAVLNAANERAVQAFLDGKIPFPDITRLTEQALGRHEVTPDPTLEDILTADRWGRLEVEKCLKLP